MPLDPQKSRLDREREKAAKNDPPPLEPPFPFVRIPFDAGFFSADLEPAKPEQTPGQRPV